MLPGQDTYFNGSTGTLGPLCLMSPSEAEEYEAHEDKEVSNFRLLVMAFLPLLMLPSQSPINTSWRKKVLSLVQKESFLWLLFSEEIPIHPSCQCCPFHQGLLLGILIHLGKNESTWATFCYILKSITDRPESTSSDEQRIVRYSDDVSFLKSLSPSPLHCPFSIFLNSLLVAFSLIQDYTVAANKKGRDQ